MASHWYRSLYWRAAIGFVLGLAAMLVVQAMLFVWIVPGSGPTVPARPERFGQTVAADISEALARDPAIDLDQFVRSQFGRNALPFVILMEDGRIVDRAGRLSNELVRLGRARIDRRTDDRGDRWRGRGGRGGRGDVGFSTRFLTTPIMVNGERRGVVVVSPTPPFGFLLRRFAPMLALIGGGVLIVGAILTAFVIFGPARRRLREVERAARRLGAGDLAARAPAGGGDEVAEVAAAFNAMAADLGARAEALATSDRTRRQLLADVSHELTTPVTAIRGYLETLSMPEMAADEPTRQRYLGIIRDETARLERIIGDLLDLAKLEGGGGSVVISDVPVAQLFERVAARHERASADAGIRIETIVEPGAETMRGDRDRLEQALQNLAANALRYAPAGSAIELRAAPTAGGLVITVSDEGAGIAPEHLPHVFDRFYKAEGSRTVRRTAGSAPADGSGLGLSIVRAIVERLGGTITVESRPGRTVFKLTFDESAA
jgi:signal transduction histidine kinase